MHFESHLPLPLPLLLLLQCVVLRAPVRAIKQAAKQQQQQAHELIEIFSLNFIGIQTVKRTEQNCTELN